jgi:hypothetical protein
MQQKRYRRAAAGLGCITEWRASECDKSTVLKPTILIDCLIYNCISSKANHACSAARRRRIELPHVSSLRLAIHDPNFQIVLYNGSMPQRTQAPIATKAPTKPNPPALAILSAAAA